MDDFNWSENDEVIVPSIQAVAVYRNSDGGVTIRQEADWNEEQDSFVYFPREYAKIIAQAILRAAEEVAP